MELPKIREAVKRCTALKTDADVSVETYADILPVLLSSAPQTAGTSVPLMLGSHAKEIAVGILAAASLLIVSMMVRKSAPAPVLPPMAEDRSAPHLEMAEDIAGEAGENNPAMDGMELDEDAIKTQQMLSQVSTMVDENPDAAANLVKRWLNRT